MNNKKSKKIYNFEKYKINKVKQSENIKLKIYN